MSSLLLPSCALLLAFGMTAGATPVPPDSTVQLFGATGSTNPQWAGTIDNDGNVAFEIRNDSNEVILSGIIQDRVTISRTTGNINISPRLRDLLTPNGTARVVRYVTTGFSGFDLEIEYPLTGSGEVGPGQVTRSAGDGGTLDFTYSDSPIAPPDESRFMSISVNSSLSFQPTGTATIFAEESPGGPVFSTEVTGVAAPLLTDPTDLKIVAFERRPDGRISLQWTGIPNRWHEIHHSANGITWTNFTDRFCDGSTITSIFTPPGNPDTQYYRLVLP